jgi:hypothetical protein
MLRIVTIGSLLALAGCATSQTIYGPDGRQYTRVECNGLALTHQDCYAKALAVCPQGYFLADQGTWESRPQSFAASWGSSSAQRTSVSGVGSQGTARSDRQSVAHSGGEIYRHVVVACK